MTDLTAKQFTTTAKHIAATLLGEADACNLSRDDTANLAGSALLEVLAQTLGPFGAVERLRSIADVAERQVLDQMRDPPA